LFLFFKKETLLPLAAATVHRMRDFPGAPWQSAITNGVPAMPRTHIEVVLFCKKELLS
jgi:hypothetical protein